MEQDVRLKLQACLDGELSDREAAEVRALAGRDPEAAALMRELEMTSAALHGQEEGIRVPDSREFYWSKIQRAIESQEAIEARAATPSGIPLWRRLLIPLGACATVAIVAVALLWNGPGKSNTAKSRPEQPAGETSTYSIVSDEGNVTVIWVNNIGN
jgi:anti-sigma factor RsiW